MDPKILPQSPQVTAGADRGNDQDSGGLPAPWLLPRIDDWAGAASLGPCAQLNSSQSLRPWKPRPPSRPHCPHRIPVSSRSRLQFLFSATFSGSAVLFVLPSFSTATHDTHFFLHSSRPHPPIRFSGLRSLFLRGHSTLRSKPRDRFRFTTHISSNRFTYQCNFRTDTLRQLSCPILLRHFAPLSTSTTAVSDRHHVGDPIFDAARAGGFCQRPDP